MCSIVNAKPINNNNNNNNNNNRKALSPVGDLQRGPDAKQR